MSLRRATIAQFISKYANIAAQLVITAILARLLTPADYGEVAIITVFTSLFAVFTDMGIGVAIIQFRDLTAEDHRKLFTFSLVLATGLSLLFAACAVPLSLFYSDLGLVPLFLASIPSLFFSTLNTVPNGLLLRDKRFGVIAVRVVVVSIFSGICAIVAAFAGWGAYALIGQSCLSAFLTLAWNLRSSSLRGLDFHFMGPLRLVFSYSSFQFGFTLINYFSRNLDNMLIGRIFGDTSLGYYDKAYKLTTYPMTAFSSVISGVVQPYMAEHQKEPSYIWDFWKKITKTISLVAAVVAAVLVASSQEVVLLFYGSQWGASSPLFFWLSISIYTQMIGSTSGSFLQSLGRTDLLFKSGIINTCIAVVFLVIGLSTGSLTAVAFCIMLSYTGCIFTTWYILVDRAFGQSLKVMTYFLPEVCMAIVAVLVATFVASLLSVGTLAAFAIKTVIVLAIMGAGYLATHQIKFILAVLGRA